MNRKKLTPVIAILFFVACSNPEKEVTSAEVPEVVKNSFEKKFLGANAVWVMEDGKFEANFTWDQQKMSAVFKKDGSLEESETDIKIADLPQPIQEHVKKNYGNDQINEAARIITAEGAIEYEAEVAGKDLIFDSNGNFIKVIPK